MYKESAHQHLLKSAGITSPELVSSALLKLAELHNDNTDELTKESSLEKKAIFPLALIPLIVKAGLGAMTAYGLYSGGKNIAKGNYAAGAFDLATTIPFIGWAGKGLKAGGVLARIAARGGKFGRLGTGITSKIPKGFIPGAQSTLSPFGKLRAQAANAVGSVTKPVKQGVGKAYSWLGAGGKSTPLGRLPEMWQPTGRHLTNVAKWMQRGGKGLDNAGKVIEGTRYGKLMGGLTGLGIMVGGPMAYEAMTGNPLEPPQEPQYAQPPGQYAYNQLPQGFKFSNTSQQRVY